MANVWTEYVCFCRYFVSLNQVRYEHSYQKDPDPFRRRDLFAVGVPTDSNEVRVWPRAAALPVADAAAAQRVQRSADAKERRRRRQMPGTANGHRHHNTYPYLIQWYQKGRCFYIHFYP